MTSVGLALMVGPKVSHVDESLSIKRYMVWSLLSLQSVSSVSSKVFSTTYSLREHHAEIVPKSLRLTALPHDVTKKAAKYPVRTAGKKKPTYRDTGMKREIRLTRLKE